MAENHVSINVLEVCMVPPPLGSTVPATLPLTFFDILWLRFPPVQRLFFYKSPAPFDAVVSNLKNSLSSVLQHYLPLAGAIVWPESSHKPVVQTVAGDGVRLAVAESSANFHDLVSDGLRQAAEFQPLVPELAAEENRAAVVALQVTSFGSDGFCIGISSHHAILDGKSSTSFVKLWASFCKSLVAGGDIVVAPETMPFYDRSVVVDQAGLEEIFLTDWMAIGGPNNRSLKYTPPTIPHNLFRGTFKLNTENIEKLKQFILNRWNPPHPSAHISTFTVSMAYTWVCTAVADNLFPNGEIVYGMSVDARRRVDPPVPVNYFGNCLVGRSTVLERAELMGENGVVTAMESISKLIKSMEDEGALYGAEKWVALLTEVLERNRKVLSTAGSPRFKLYDVDFGWGTPEKVEVVSINGTGAVCVCDGRDGGLELAWSARREVMENFAVVFAKGLQQL